MHNFINLLEDPSPASKTLRCEALKPTQLVQSSAILVLKDQFQANPQNDDEAELRNQRLPIEFAAGIVGDNEFEILVTVASIEFTITCRKLGKNPDTISQITQWKVISIVETSGNKKVIYQSQKDAQRETAELSQHHASPLPKLDNQFLLHPIIPTQRASIEKYVLTIQQAAARERLIKVLAPHRLMIAAIIFLCGSAFMLDKAYPSIMGHLGSNLASALQRK